ncbi:MAG: ornithine cyclodeaminase family protein [Rhodospirillaceae bacterium]|jgi:ornithine cyclodeaminase/alanine dehydrogenase-like protein (mu-crystallin family)|nr:ornithine cyclodeaminase family protein [Rhodospirillaceae bacterium]MBT5566353.1 ornithine cyclodeaminase family protein [Rhodospirillaceae bacterium]MBT6088446.1 ornithine cyclodeaminase family protein [Rhodospirillaceae bacterium]
MLVLNREAVAASLSHAECVDLMEGAMRAVSRGDVVMPLRQFMAVPNTQGKLGMMPGYVGVTDGQESVFGIKVVSKFPREPGSPLSSHVGAVLLFETKDGLPVALMDGRELTAIRTSATTAMATRVLARADAALLTFIGCGEEARHHIQAILPVRPIKKIVIWGRNVDRANEFAAKQALPAGVSIEVEPDIQKAVEEAEILCTVTSSTQPILKGAWLKPGVHVNLVGAAVRASAEADIEVVKRSRFYVDYLPSALEQAGELVNAIEAGVITASHVVGEIGAVLNGDASGRTSDDEITVYKSLGVAAQDLAAGMAAAENAKANDFGTAVDW